MDKSKQIDFVDYNPDIHHTNYFSPQSGSSWGPRTIGDIELILILDGKFHYHDVDGTEEFFSKAELCIIPPGVEHVFRHVSASGKAGGFIGCIHLEFLSGKSLLNGDYRLGFDLPIKTRVSNFNEMAEFFRLVAQHYNSSSVCSMELAKNAAKMVLLYCYQQWSETRSQPVSAMVEEMTGFLRERFMDPVSREDLARKFKMSPQYVNRLFRKELGVTPTEYLNRYRIDIACEYLDHKGMKVSDVGLLVGFDDPFYFSRVFKKYTGYSPSERVKKPHNY